MNTSPHILIAEDDDLVALALGGLLESQGFRVTVTHNGQQALEAEGKEAVDILLTDMRMPVLGGGELIRQVRQRRPDLPIVVMTGYSEDCPRQEPGRLTILRKPFSADLLACVLQSMLKSVLGSKAEPRSA